MTLAWLLTPLLARAITMQDFTVSLETTARPIAILAVAGIVTVVTLVVSVVPAWRLSRVDLHPSMVGAGRTTAAGGGQRLSRHLIVAQLALSLLLVALAGLFLRTVAGLTPIDPGFEPNHVVLLEVQREQLSAPSTNPMYEKPRLAALYRGLSERLATIPGVSAVGMSWLGLFGGSDLWLPVIRTDAPTDRHDARTDYVTAGYFESVGMRIVRGRSFTDADRDGAPRVAIVNETFVRQRFPGVEPLGHAVTLEYPAGSAAAVHDCRRRARFQVQRRAGGEGRADDLGAACAVAAGDPGDHPAHARRRGSVGDARGDLDRDVGRSDADGPAHPDAARSGRSNRRARAALAAAGVGASVLALFLAAVGPLRHARALGRTPHPRARPCAWRSAPASVRWSG